MKVLVDTNILARLSQAGHPQQSIAASAVKSLLEAGHELRIVPQVIYEYWAIATRPADENGLGLTITEAQGRLLEFKTLLPPLRDERGILDRWQELVVDRAVRGKPSHDARIVAAMLRHGMTHLLTFNDADFKRYPEVTVLLPSQGAPSTI